MSRTYRYTGKLGPADILSDHESKLLAKRLNEMALQNDGLFDEMMREMPLRASFRRNVRRCTSRPDDVTLGDFDA